MYLVWFSLFFLFFFFFPSGVLAAGVLVCLVRFIYAWLTVSTVGLFLVFFPGIGNRWPGKWGRQLRFPIPSGGLGLWWNFLPGWAGGDCRPGLTWPSGTRTSRQPKVQAALSKIYPTSCSTSGAVSPVW